MAGWRALGYDRDSKVKSVHGSGGTPTATNGCTNTSSTVVTCTIGSKAIDSITIAGWHVGDILDVVGVPHPVSIFIVGGDGADWLIGAGEEDVLVDGTGTFGDTLEGKGNSDALINTAGDDALVGGDGSDLLLSSAACEGDDLYGDSGSGESSLADNASWAISGSAVSAELNASPTVAGTPGTGNLPTCSSGTLTNLSEINSSRARGSTTI